MWYWLLPEKRNKWLFICELAGLSVLLHVFIGCIILVIQAQQSSIKIQINAQGKVSRPVLFLPGNRGRAANGTRNGVKNGPGTGSGKAANVPERSVTEKVQRSEWASATVGAPSKKKAAAVKQKKAAQPKKSRVQKKKPQPKKEVAAKKEKPVPPKPVEQPKAEMQKQPVPSAPVKPEPAPLVQAQPESQALANDAVEGVAAGVLSGSMDGADVFMVTPGADMSLEAVIMQETLQQEMNTHWHPPIGLSKDLICQIKVTMANDGSVENILVEKSSGVLAYDMSVRAAAMRMMLPQWGWGKEFVLTFKQ